MNKNTTTAVIGLTILFAFAYFFFQYNRIENTPGENTYRLANKHLEDGNYEEALRTFDDVLAQYPDYKEAHLGRAITLMQMGALEDSRPSFDKAIELDADFAQAYANRGILNDRTGNYEEAVTDYKKAITLNPELTEGPGYLWRFLHNVSERPPTIADRAVYIEAELKKPEAERLLRVPELDEQQRMYKK
ncbi:MAG: tetratricopeptide repeat protein [Nitrospiraceae bacterium]|nr:MAG: tetratricopeptide repeat protein [Nitrospiraceae bacterium]